MLPPALSCLSDAAHVYPAANYCGEQEMSDHLPTEQISSQAALHCVQEYPWIVTEKHFFGRPGSDYDFEAHNVDAAFQELQGAQDSQQRLANRVNRKVGLKGCPSPCMAGSEGHQQYSCCSSWCAGLHPCGRVQS